MRILFIIYSLTGGGAERVAANVMSWLGETHDVTACLLEPRNPETEYPLNPNVHVIELPQDRNANELVRYRNLVKSIRRLKRHGGYDAAVSFLELGNFLNAATRTPFGPRTIISIRNLASRKNELIAVPQSRKRWAALQGRLAQTVVCVSQDVASDQIAHFGCTPRKVRVINNWIEAGAVQAQADEAIDDPVFESFAAVHPFLIVNSGRLNVQKGQWHLIRAVGALRRDYPDVGLVILGEGRGNTNLQPQLEDVIAHEGLKGDVLLAGRKTNPFAYMKRAQVFALPSLFEGFSNAILEAMALGLPVVADDCAGVRECLTPTRESGGRSDEIIWGNYGIVTPLLSAEWPEGELDSEERQLYEALKALYEQPELREEYRAKSLACIERYTPEIIMQQWMDVIDGR